MGEEADADWQAGLVEWGKEEGKRDPRLWYCERCEENYTPKNRDYRCPRCWR